MNKAILSIGGLLAAGALLVGVTVLSGAVLKSARLDLTEGKQYTLSAGSRNIASKLAEPIKLTLYYSDKQSSSVPAPLKSYAARVKEVLGEYARASGGKIDLQIVDPEPFSETEDKAVAAELMGAPLQTAGGEMFYFGLVGVNSTDRQETIKFFSPEREEFLEYDLTRLIYLLSEPAKKAVGIMSWLPIEGSSGPNPMARQQQSPPWIIVRQMRELFDVKTIATDAAEIPADIKVLVVVHPKRISESAQYAIDQFVLRGGRLLVFVDPQCESDVPPGLNQMQAMQIPKNSNLPKLFDAWGLEMIEGVFAADRASAVKVNVGQGRSEIIDYIAYIRLTADSINPDDAVSGSLKDTFFGTSGILRKKGDVGTEFTSLIHTSEEAAPLGTSLVSFMPDPKKLLADFTSGGQPLTVAARVTGKAKTAFPAGRPAATPPPPPPGEPAPPPPATTTDPNFIAESTEPINIIVVADCDMLTDRFWVREDIFGARKVADNGDLVIGAIDNLSGSSDLISVRSRGKFSRPFDRVVKLQKEAEKKYAEEQQKLEARLRETEQKINELQQRRGDKNTGAMVLTLTPAQEQEIENFQKEKIETRKQLRQVQLDLRKDIEGLGTRLKFINVALMPIAVGCAAVGLSLYRASRRRVDRWKPKPRD